LAWISLAHGVTPAGESAGSADQAWRGQSGV